MANRGKVRLKDIAQACGVSINTVSCAMRNDPRISEATARRIRQVAEKMGYVRNSLASSLRFGRTGLAAVIVRGLHNSYFSGMIHSIEVSMREAGYHIMVLSITEDGEAESIVRFAISMSVDGIFYYPTTADVSAVQILRQHGIPTVLLGRSIPNAGTDMLCLDSYQGGLLVAGRCMEANHRRVVYLEGPPRNIAQEERKRGLIDGLGPKTELTTVSFSEHQRAILDGSLPELLSGNTCAVAYNDDIAYQVMNALQKAGRIVPKDISMVGFDHIRAFMPYLPPLSSVSVASGSDYARSAVQLLSSRIQQRDQDPRLVILPASLYDEGSIIDQA